MRHVVFIAIALTLSTMSASADDTLPSLTLQADTAGNGAKLKAGFDLQYGIPFTTIISPFLQTTTNSGVANLFAVDTKGISGSSSWDLGVTLSRIRWPDRTSDEADATGTSPRFRKLEETGYEVCRQVCDDPTQADPNDAFCKARANVLQQIEATVRRSHDVDPDLAQLLMDADEAATQASDAERQTPPPGNAELTEKRKIAAYRRNLVTQALDTRARNAITVGHAITVESYCSDARRLLEADLNAHYDPWSSIPRTVWSLGLSLGMTVDKFLEPMSTGGLSLTSRAHSTQSAAFLLVKHMRGLTFELPVLAQRKFKLASSDKARWCVPAGTVVTSSGTMSQGESCDEQPLGPLNRRYSLQVGAFLGSFSPSSFWRLAVGPVASVSSRADGDTNNSYKVGAVLPLYVGTGLLKKDLKGLVRVSLSGMYEKAGDGSTDRTLSITLAILSSSTLFPSVFDQF